MCEAVFHISHPNFKNAKRLESEGSPTSMTPDDEPDLSPPLVSIRRGAPLHFGIDS